jgi:Uncharacterized conserved protein (COG2071)
VDFTVTVRDLLFVTWEASPERVGAVLPGGLEPELAGSSALVTLSVARAVGGRFGWLRVPRFSKLTVHTYVTGSEGPGLCFLDSWVSRSAFGRRLVGVPFAAAQIRARSGFAEAPSLGVSIRYRTGGKADPVELASGVVGSHQLAYFESGSLFGLHASHSPIVWETVELLARPRFGPVETMGFAGDEPSSLLYAARVPFRVELPPARVVR